MTVSAAEVKKLRDMTGAGYGDCRKALIRAEGNHEEAITIFTHAGQAKARKSKAGQQLRGLFTR